VRVAPETFWRRETPTEGRFADFFCARRGGTGRVMVCESILFRHEDGYGGLRVVNVHCAASGDEFDKPRCAVVVADI
jgi:hypothetical protein